MLYYFVTRINFYVFSFNNQFPNARLSHQLTYIIVMTCSTEDVHSDHPCILN